MIKKYCVDNMILRWAMTGKADPQDEHQLPLAKAFLKDVDDSGAILIIPTPVLAEFSLKLDVDQYQDVLSMLPRKCHIAAFDHVCVQHFNKLWRNNEELAAKLRARQGLTKVALKFDYQILATAMAHNATLFTEDRELRELGKRYVGIGTLADYTQPPSIFD